MKIYCNTCDTVIDDSELEEPYGLSGCEPACPYCQGSDFSDLVKESDSVEEKVHTHNWETGKWGVIIGVSNCKKCGKLSKGTDFHLVQTEWVNMDFVSSIEHEKR